MFGGNTPFYWTPRFSIFSKAFGAKQCWILSSSLMDIVIWSIGHYREDISWQKQIELTLNYLLVELDWVLNETWPKLLGTETFLERLKITTMILKFLNSGEELTKKSTWLPNADNNYSNENYFSNSTPKMSFPSCLQNYTTKILK